MAPPDIRRPFKRPAISDQQRRRDLALLRQSQQRADSQRLARLASSVLALPALTDPEYTPALSPEAPEDGDISIPDVEPSGSPSLYCQSPLNAAQAARLKGSEARRWFARQLMLPEWMVDVPPRVEEDWYVFARPAGKRCFVVSSNGTTVSRVRNGSILHRFPSHLPNGARARNIAGPTQSYCILDCIFHEPDQTYYVIDMVCWRGYSYYDCTADFRFTWLKSKLEESGVSNPPSTYHRYRFCPVILFECSQVGLHSAYAGEAPYGKDGLLFYNKHANYHAGVTPLALVWKDRICSQYFIDTDSNGQIPSQQQVVLELGDDGKLVTSDEPPVVFSHLDVQHIQKLGLQPGALLRFSISDGGLRMLNEKFQGADLHYIGKVYRGRAFADTFSKVLFQYTARHSPLSFEELVSSMAEQQTESKDIEMVG